MFRLIAFGLVAAASIVSTVKTQTSQPAWQSIPEGQLILRPFANAPYPHKSRDEGFKTWKRDPHYIDSTVGIFIPAGYKPGEAVDYIVHFHGHNNHVANVIQKYKLPQQLAQTKVNAILLVPQGPRDAGDSGGGKLELDPNAFQNLIEEVTVFLNAEGKIHTSKIGRIALAAHSGGYKVTAAILDHGGLAENITDVLLLDASYGSLPWLADWCKSGRSHRLVTLFTDHLADENQELMKLLDTAGVAYATLDEKNLKDGQFAARMPIFMHTKGPHDQVAVDYFGRLVQTSALPVQTSALTN